MKSIFKSLLLVIISVFIVTGCGQGIDTGGDTNQGSDPDQAQGSPNVVDESNVSPIVDEEDEAITTHTVTLYFSDKELLNVYKEDREIEVNEEEELALFALKAWISGPEHEDLQSIIPPEVIIEYVKDEDGVAHVSFSEEIKNANLGSSGELALVEQVTMIMQQFGYEQTQFLIEGEVVDSLLGHMYTVEPLEANNPEEYEYVE